MIINTNYPGFSKMGGSKANKIILSNFPLYF
jgi:hypothetical protein